MCIRDSYRCFRGEKKGGGLMAKKPTEKQLYKLKNEWLGQFFEEVKPKEFYRAVFPEGSFERAGHFEDGKANGIITIVENDKAKNRIVFDDLSVIDEVKGAEFAVMSLSLIHI